MISRLKSKIEFSRSLGGTKKNSEQYNFLSQNLSSEFNMYVSNILFESTCAISVDIKSKPDDF